MVTHDDFEAVTESVALIDELRERIAREGPMTFRDFMNAALYHPRHGYYRTRTAPTSRGGDFVTSPEVHPVFGALVAKQLRQMWELMDRPEPFGVVEQGAGRGLLARDIVRWVRRNEPQFAGALHYRIIEPADAARREQERTLDELSFPAGTVEWLGDVQPFEGVFLSNELLDAFPVHRVTMRDGELLEVYVSCDEAGRFVDAPGTPSTPALRAYFDSLGVLPGDGCLAEVNLDAQAWIARVANALIRGYVLTFDYGYEARELYAPWRRDGTLLCFYRQSASSDPYRRIGRQDMTASIDFTTLRSAGERAGLRTAAVTDQASFLMRLGINEGLASAARERPQEIEEYYARRKVVLDLIDPARLGRITVLAQAKGVDDAPLRGFVDD